MQNSSSSYARSSGSDSFGSSSNGFSKSHTVDSFGGYQGGGGATGGESSLPPSQVNNQNRKLILVGKLSFQTH